MPDSTTPQAVARRRRDACRRALERQPIPRPPSWARSAPAGSPSTTPIHHYGSHEAYLGASPTPWRYEYKAIADAGFGLQIDSPDLAMAAHCRSVGSSVGDWQTHLPLAIEALNRALDGIAPEQVRLHLCWGNYAGPHHKDVPLADILMSRSSRPMSARSTPKARTRATSTSGACSRT